MSGPFGLSMGMKLEDLRMQAEQELVKLSNIDCDQYEIVPISKHSSFDSYNVNISEKYGLYRIVAIGKIINTSVHGHEVKNEFKNLVDGFSKGYGKCNLSDFLSYGSIWNEPQDWMNGLLHRERFLAADWSVEHQSNMKNDLTSINIFTFALDQSSAQLIVNYYFSNSKDAESEKKDLEDSIL